MLCQAGGRRYAGSMNLSGKACPVLTALLAAVGAYGALLLALCLPPLPRTDAQ